MLQIVLVQPECATGSMVVDTPPLLNTKSMPFDRAPLGAARPDPIAMIRSLCALSTFP